MTSMTPVANQQRLREIHELPGPRGWPLVGNLLQIERSRVHQDIEAWARQYGPSFRMRFGPTEFLVVTDHEAIVRLLRDRPDGVARLGRTAEIGVELGFNIGLFDAEGEAWRRQRRMVMASFAPAHVRSYLPSLHKVTRRLQGRWERAARGGADIDLQADLMRYTVDAIAGLAFGAEVNTLESDSEVIQQHLDKVLPALFKRSFSLLPWWRLVRSPQDRRLERSVAALKEAIAGFIGAARARLRDDPARRAQPANLLEAMLVAADEPGSDVGDADVAGNVITLLLAGEDTTANTLAWMIHLMHRHPEVLRRAQDEVRRLAPEAGPVTLEQMDALPYLDACAQETMRLKPVAPFLPLRTLRDTTVGDVRVPAETFVWCVLRHDSVAERHFPQAESFRPERWLPDGGPAQALSSAKRIAMPFGAGPRVCPGRYLAMLEIKMAMVMLLNRFDIESVDTPEGGPARELMAFTMSPIGLRMRLRERSAN